MFLNCKAVNRFLDKSHHHMKRKCGLHGGSQTYSHTDFQCLTWDKTSRDTVMTLKKCRP